MSGDYTGEYNTYQEAVFEERSGVQSQIDNRVKRIDVNDLKEGEFLGNGAFGKVYDGEYKGVAVAIKWLEMEHARRKLGGAASDDEIIESFNWEATNLSLVNHPNIVSLIGIVDDGVDRRGLVLELCDGMDLEKLLFENKSENRSMSLRQQFSIIFQLLCGLKYLHEKGIIHKDVKVENVLWFRDGRVKWADLGVSAVDSLVQENEAALSQAGMKDAYWNSPEEARIRLGIDDDNDGVALAASDVFSFGLIMYAVMSGKGKIWEGSGLKGLRAIQECLCGDRVTQVLKLDDSWWCYDLMQQCFAFNPQDRPTASGLLEFLKQWAHNSHDEVGRVMLSHELILNIHSSEEDRQTYIENLCSTNKGDVDSFGGKDEAEFAQIDRVSSFSDCVSEFLGFERHRAESVSRSATMCRKKSEKKRCNCCMAKFSFFRWKHHCRVCGFVVCDKCSRQKIVVPDHVNVAESTKKLDRSSPVRVCDVCVSNVTKTTDSGSLPVPDSPPRSSDRVLLLLGDGGTGKSTGVHVVAAMNSQYSSDDGEEDIQFVFIRPRVKQWSLDSLRGACNGIGGDGLVFVLDGYDELRGHNVDVGVESLPEYLGMSSTSRLIVTCRRNIVPDNRISSVFGGYVRVRYLLPFTKNQIGEYLEMCGAPQPSSPISNPFLLKLYSSSWQHLKSAGDHLEKDIYDASIRAWFIEACGLDDELKSELSVENFDDFACHVAMSMFIDGNRVATSFPSEQSRKEDPQQVSSSPWFVLEDRVAECAAQLFDSRTSGDNARRSVLSRDDFIRNKLQLLTTQFLHKCPLQKKPGTQLFSFIHKSYRDYFCGMAMTRMMNVYIDKVLVTSDVAVQQWCSRFVDIVAARQHCEVGSLSVGELEESIFSISALEFIEHTRHADPSPSLSIGGANCMTVLNTAGVPLSGRNFSGAQLGDTGDDSVVRRSDQPFMDLGGAMLYGCDFSGANLSGARLQQACMDYVNFAQCNMSGVEFGERPSFLGHSWNVDSLCLSHDGAYLYSGSFDMSINVWSVSSGKKLRTMKGHGDEVLALCLSSDGEYLYSGSKDSKAIKWELSSAQSTITFAEHKNGVPTVRLSSNDKWLFTGSWDNSIKQWSTKSGEVMRTFEEAHSLVYTIALPDEWGTFYSSGGDNIVKQWSTVTGQLIRQFEGHTGCVYSLCISPDRQYIYSGSGDGTVKQWVLSTGELVRTLEGHTNWVHSVVISSDNLYVYSCAEDKTIKQWSCLTGQLVRTLEGHSSGVNDIILSSDDTTLFSAAKDNTVMQWPTTTGSLVRHQDEHHTDSVYSLCVSLDGTQCYSASYDKTLKIWSTKTGKMLSTVGGEHTRGIYTVCLSVDGEYLFTGCDDRRIRQFSTKTMTLKSTIHSDEHGHAHGVLSLCVSPDGEYVYSGSRDGTVKKWQIGSGELVYTFDNGLVLGAWSVCVSSHCEWLWSGHGTGLIIQWAATTGELLREMKGHNSSVNAMCLCRGDTFLLSASNDNTVKQWSVESGELVRTFESHTTYVTALCLSLDEKFVYGGSFKRCIVQWSMNSGEIVRLIEGHSDGVTDLCMSPDGYMYSSSKDYTVKQWVTSAQQGHVISWSSPPFKMSASNVTIENATNLNKSDRRLLEQKCGLVEQRSDVVAKKLGLVDNANNVDFNRTRSF